MCSLQRAAVLKAGEGVGDCPRPKKHTKKPRGMDYDPQSEWVGREHHMRRIIVVLAAMAAMVVVYAGAAWAASVSEVEPNDSRDQAQNIDGSSFSLDFDSNIGNAAINTSESVPHATINGTGNDTRDYYSFTVSQAGDGVILDVDGAFQCNEEGCSGFDSYLLLFDSSGQRLAEDDDESPEWGQGGSTSYSDSYLEYTFQTPGTYYVIVSSDIPQIPSGESYKLQVSLGDLPELFLCNSQLPTIEAQPGRATNGTKGNDVIAGTEGRDTINGNGGIDTICGKDGNDTINGGADDDTIYGGDGDDSISGGAGRDPLYGGAGNDSISGGDDIDYGFGGDGNDLIKGDKGSDALYGEGDNDTIDGGLGIDYISGGDGTDKCSLAEAGRDACELGLRP
jgi:Ca2+-binding RTX toxin-like protein